VHLPHTHTKGQNQLYVITFQPARYLVVSASAS